MSTDFIPWTSYGKALLAIILWDCSFIAIRYALDTASPFGTVWMRNPMADALWMLTTTPAQYTVSLTAIDPVSTGNDFGYAAAVDTTILEPVIVPNLGCGGTSRFFIDHTNLGASTPDEIIPFVLGARRIGHHEYRARSASDGFTVVSSEVLDVNDRIEVVDEQGRVLHSARGTGARELRIMRSGLQSGMYLLRVFSKHGPPMITKLILF